MINKGFKNKENSQGVKYRISYKYKFNMTEVKQKQVLPKSKMELEDKASRKSSSLISSSRSESSDSSVSQSKYQKKQLQSSKKDINDKTQIDKLKKKQSKYSSGSRSLSSSSDKRSRSIKKQKKSHRHRNRSRSRDDRRDKNRSERYRDDRKQSKYRDDRDRDRKRDHRDRDRDRDRKYDDRRDRRDRDRERSRDKNRRDRKQETKRSKQIINTDNKLLPHQIPMPIEVSMPPIPGQRRRRQRSRSPLGYYRRNQNNNQGEFWDSFSWVPRINYTPNVSSSALVNTKKMRRLMITNIPYQMGISKEDLRQLITRFMTQNYLKDSMNNCPVRDLEPNEEDHSAAVELSSVEETCRMCKLQKVQLFKGYMNGIIRLGDSCYGNNVVTQAQNAAQAQAAAFAAINVLENKKTSFNMEASLNKGPEASTLLRVTNAVTPYMAENMTPQQMEDYHEDLIQGLSQFGKIVHNWFVKPSEKDICANAGDLFVQYESQEDAIKAMNEMQGKFYDERVIKIFYVPRQIYYPNFKKDLTPPAIKAPLKPKKQNPLNNLQQLSKSSHIASKTQ